MKNLFTAIDNATENGKTIYQVRFTTDDPRAYEAALAAARRILDGNAADEPAERHFNPIRRKARTVVYICSPYRGDKDRNIAYARELVKRALSAGLSPICPHLYLPQILDDDKPEERKQALRVGLELLNSCSVVIVGARYGISDGMKAEIERARELGKRIHNYD